LYIPVVALLAQSADALYAERANLTSAKKAAEIWTRAASGSEQDATSTAIFEASWKLSRANYWLGGHAPERERRAFLERGTEAGRRASTIEPQRPEGYFWMAANMGALAESFGVRDGLKYRQPIRQALETVLRIDPAFQQGSADRALGRWYFKVPRLFGGSNRDAEAHLRASLTYNADSISSRFFLAEVLFDEGRKNDARAELQRAIDAPVDPAWVPEDTEFKTKARALLERR